MYLVPGLGNGSHSGHGPDEFADHAEASQRIRVNGQAQNPQKRLIEALARTFGVPPAFFFDD